ncbi:MAG: septum formation initiator family protein [Smithella sp.]|jgi:cell division protein FtsB|nr:septum formation initiator family protein [Smithellaceae bacterium]NLA41389.1 septum formation initiator family protein [Smithella sp.]
MKIGRYLAAFVFFMMLLIAFGNRGVVDNYFIAKKLSQLKAENNSLIAENKELAGKILLLRSDPAYIESIARNELGMVKPGDMVYRLTR